MTTASGDGAPAVVPLVVTAADGLGSWRAHCSPHTTSPSTPQNIHHVRLEPLVVELGDAKKTIPESSIRWEGGDPREDRPASILVTSALATERELAEQYGSLYLPPRETWIKQALLSVLNVFMWLLDLRARDEDKRVLVHLHPIRLRLNDPIYDGILKQRLILETRELYIFIIIAFILANIAFLAAFDLTYYRSIQNNKIVSLRSLDSDYNPSTSAFTFLSAVVALRGFGFLVAALALYYEIWWKRGKNGLLVSIQRSKLRLLFMVILYLSSVAAVDNFFNIYVDDPSFYPVAITPIYAFSCYTIIFMSAAPLTYTIAGSVICWIAISCSFVPISLELGFVRSGALGTMLSYLIVILMAFATRYSRERRKRMRFIELVIMKLTPPSAFQQDGFSLDGTAMHNPQEIGLNEEKELFPEDEPRPPQSTSEEACPLSKEATDAEQAAREAASKVLDPRFTAVRSIKFRIPRRGFARLAAFMHSKSLLPGPKNISLFLPSTPSEGTSAAQFAGSRKRTTGNDRAQADYPSAKRASIATTFVGTESGFQRRVRSLKSFIMFKLLCLYEWKHTEEAYIVSIMSYSQEGLEVGSLTFLMTNAAYMISLFISFPQIFETNLRSMVYVLVGTQLLMPLLTHVGLRYRGYAFNLKDLSSAKIVQHYIWQNVLVTLMLTIGILAWMWAQVFTMSALGVTAVQFTMFRNRAIENMMFAPVFMRFTYLQTLIFLLVSIFSSVILFLVAKTDLLTTSIYLLASVATALPMARECEFENRRYFEGE